MISLSLENFRFCRRNVKDDVLVKDDAMSLSSTTTWIDLVYLCVAK